MNSIKMMTAIAVFGLTGVLSAQAVMIADFNTASKPNNVGGDFGAWDKDPTDKTQYCREAFDNVNTRTGSGYSMRLSYDVDSPMAAYNGFWMKLGNMDATGLKKLVFWAKGDEKKGCTSRMKVELKTASARGSSMIENLGPAWTKYEIPLDAFNIADLSALAEIVLVFDDINSVPKEGILYIDDITLE